MKLTDSKIRNASAKDRAYKMSDGDGLQLLVRPNGKKLWQIRYRFAERERTLSVGAYPSVLLCEAREARTEAQKLLRQNIDPVSRKREERIAAIYNDRNSFRAVAEEWRERNRENWTEKYDMKTWGRLENHVLPYIGRRPVSAIKPLELLTVFHRIEKAGMTEMSNRVFRLCASIFRFAVITGRIEVSPARDLGGALKPHRNQHFVALPVKDLSGFLRNLEATSTSPQNKIAMKLLIHTAVRTGELRHARWQDIGENEWRIPAQFTKMRSDHIVPLSAQVRELLCELREVSGSGEWLFPNQQGRVNPVMSENTINHLIHRMGYKGKAVGHGFRSLFSTVLNEKGFNRDAIERQLAHMERNSVRAAYNRAEYLDERRLLMQWWSDLIDSQKNHATIDSDFNTVDRKTESCKDDGIRFLSSAIH